MTDHNRKTLEKFARADLPLNRAIAAALRRVEDLEIALQEAVDRLDATALTDGDRATAARLGRVLEGRG